MLCGIVVFIKLGGIRKQYCGITTQPVYCSTLYETIKIEQEVGKSKFGNFPIANRQMSFSAYIHTLLLLI